MRGRWVTTAVAVLLIVLVAVPQVGASSRRALKRAIRDLPCEGSIGPGGSGNVKGLAVQDWTPDIRVGDLDIHGDLLVGNIYGDPGGITTVDISDPLNPKWIGKGQMAAWALDAKITDDGTTAVVGLDHFGYAGIALFDIRKPESPRLMHEWTSQRPGILQMGHMISTANIDETDWIFVAPYDSTGIWIFKLTGPAGNKKIEYVTSTLPVEGGPGGPHDTFVTFDKDLETWVMYVADSNEGWLAYDVGDPANPQLLGGFLHPSAGSAHTIQAGKIAGKRIVVTIEEIGANMMKVYDATNLLRPTLLGVWWADTLPLAIQHNIQIVKKHVYVAHIFHGIFIFDLEAVAKAGKPLVSEIEPVAQYQVHEENFYDVVLKDGLIYGSRYKQGGGFDVVAFGCIPAANPAYTSKG